MLKVRPLSPELQAKAIAELNEDPKRIPEDVEHIREWLLKQPHLKARTEDQFILIFLRGCKFSLERTKEKLETFYTIRSLLPEMFSNRDPFDPKIQEILKEGFTLPLLKLSGPDALRGTLFRFGRWDPNKHNLELLMKVDFMILDILLNEDDNRVVAGMWAMQDGTGMHVNQLLHMNPSLMKKAGMYFQDALPFRPKAMHYFNPPSFIETLFNMFRPLLKEKLLKRMHIHNTKNIEDMYQFIPKEILPSEYGGDAGPIQDLVIHWKEKIESYADWFKEDELKYGCDESKRPGKPKTSTDMFGIEGSFRKLNVD